jgi:hypothetical protein
MLYPVHFANDCGLALARAVDDKKGFHECRERTKTAFSRVDRPVPARS